MQCCHGDSSGCSTAAAAVCSVLLVDYDQFIAQPEHTLKAALQFVGANTSRWVFCIAVCDKKQQLYFTELPAKFAAGRFLPALCQLPAELVAQDASTFNLIL